jgi:hypothetical protein
MRMVSAMSQREDKRLLRFDIACCTGRRRSAGRRSLRCGPPVGVGVGAGGGGAGSSGGGAAWFGLWLNPLSALAV